MSSNIYKQLWGAPDSMMCALASSLLKRAPEWFDSRLIIECMQYGTAPEECHTLSWALENGHMEAAALIWSKRLEEDRSRDIKRLYVCANRAIDLRMPYRCHAVKFFIQIAPNQIELLTKLLGGAASFGDLDLVQLIFDHVDAQGHELAFSCAIRRGMHSVVEYMLERRVVVPSNPRYFHYAAHHGHISMLRLIVPLTTYHAAADTELIKHAARGGDIATVEYLLGITHIPEAEHVAFNAAIEWSEIKLVKYLLSRYDAPQMTDDLFWATVRRRRDDTFKMLYDIRERGFRPSRIDHDALDHRSSILNALATYGGAMEVAMHFIKDRQIDLTPLIDGDARLKREQFKMAFQWICQHPNPGEMLPALIELGLAYSVNAMVCWAKAVGALKIAKKVQEEISCIDAA